MSTTWEAVGSWETISCNQLRESAQARVCMQSALLVGLPTNTFSFEVWGLPV